VFDVNGVSFKTRFLTLFASATLLVAFVPTVGISPVSASPILAEANVPDGAGGDPNGDVQDEQAANGEAFDTENSASDETPKNEKNTGKIPTETKPGGKIVPKEPTGPQVASVDILADFEAWFYETKIGYSPHITYSGVETLSFDIIAEGRCGARGDMKADRSYPYNGNAIPLPTTQSGEREKRLVWVRQVTKGTNYTNTTPYEEWVIDPGTGNFEINDAGSVVQSWTTYSFVVTCKWQTAPGWSPKECVTFGTTQIFGPYDQKWQAMLPVTEGGTNTRTPKNPSVIEVIGRVYEQDSVPLGKDMRDSGLNPQSDKPTASQMMTDCIPSSANKFSIVKSPSIGSLGRYITEYHQWWVTGWYFVFTTENWPNIYKGSAALGAPMFKTIGSEGFQLISASKPVERKFYDYNKMICKDGSSPGGLVSLTAVALRTKAAKTDVDWADGNPEYYTWNCGDPPGNGPSHDPAVDFLQCDNYKQTQTAPYQYDRLDYTYSTNTYDVYGWVTRTQFRDRGADFINGEWVGRPCNPGEYDAGHNCAVDYQSWERIGSDTSTVKNPTPAGYEDNGTYWYRKAAPPAGWIDNGTEYESSSFSKVKVDNKNAAPLISAAQLVNGKAVALEKVNGVYVILDAADPVHFEWTRIRINNRNGQNINNVGKNVEWQYTYKLAPWSSPMLKGVDVNALNQPYHGWVDSNPSTVDIAEIPASTKWEPDKFYEYKTIPYSFTYKPYTYTNSTELRERQVTTRQVTEWVHNGWGYDWGCSCGGKCGNWPNGDPYCQYPTYGWETRTITEIAPPPAGCYDDGANYVCPTQVKNPAPEGYVDNGTQYQAVNPAPAGYVDNGYNGYTTKDVVNDSGKTGGIAFNKWRSWPSTSGQEECTINMSDYSSSSSGSYTISCGDNVTENTRAAYFRFFMSSTAGSNGWQVTPWARVSVDMATSFTEFSSFVMTDRGSVEWIPTRVDGQSIRQSYDCPAEPVRINVDRVVTN
jgi:hypothetical protein